MKLNLGCGDKMRAGYLNIDARPLPANGHQFLCADIRDLRGMNFLALVAERGRFYLQTALETARRRPEPIVAEITAVAGESALALELFLAPLAARAGSPACVPCMPSANARVPPTLSR